MRVARRPTGKQHFAGVGFVVTVGVFQIERFGGVLHDDAAAMEGERRGDAELFGEHGELVGPAVAVGVFADANAIASLSFGREFVRVVDRFAEPEPAPRVPRHGERLADIRFRGEEPQFEVIGMHIVLERFFRRERKLHLVPLAVSLARPAGGIVRHLGFHILKRLHVGTTGRHLRLIGGEVGVGAGELGVVAAGPTDAAFDEIVKACVRPRALIVPPGRVEDAALGVRARPGPGLGKFFAVVVFLGVRFQHHAVRFVVLGVVIRFVEALETGEPAHDFMVGQGDGRTHHLFAMPLKLGADEFNVLRRIAEAVRRTMERDETVPGRDVFQERRFLLGGDLVDVRVDDEPVVLGERFLV